MAATLEWAMVDGQQVHAKTFRGVPPGNRPIGICPHCEEPVIWKAGEEKAPHVAHQSQSECSATAPETAAHINAKMALAEALRKAGSLSISHPCPKCRHARSGHWRSGWSFVEVEVRAGKRRPDIVLLTSERAVLGAIEVKHSHAVDSEKARDLAEAGVAWIEVEAPVASAWQGEDMVVCNGDLASIALALAGCPECLRLEEQRKQLQEEMRRRLDADRKLLEAAEERRLAAERDKRKQEQQRIIAIEERPLRRGHRFGRWRLSDSNTYASFPNDEQCPLEDLGISLSNRSFRIMLDNMYYGLKTSNFLARKMLKYDRRYYITEEQCQSILGIDRVSMIKEYFKIVRERYAYMHALLDRKTLPKHRVVIGASYSRDFSRTVIAYKTMRPESVFQYAHLPPDFTPSNVPLSYALLLKFGVQQVSERAKGCSCIIYIEYPWQLVTINTPSFPGDMSRESLNNKDFLIDYRVRNSVCTNRHIVTVPIVGTKEDQALDDANREARRYFNSVYPELKPRKGE